MRGHGEGTRGRAMWASTEMILDTSARPPATDRCQCGCVSTPARYQRDPSSRKAPRVAFPIRCEPDRRIRAARNHERWPLVPVDTIWAMSAQGQRVRCRARPRVSGAASPDTDRLRQQHLLVVRAGRALLRSRRGRIHARITLVASPALAAYRYTVLGDGAGGGGGIALALRRRGPCACAHGRRRRGDLSGASSTKSW